MNRTAGSRRFRLLYVCWLLLCAILFIALRGAEDPSRRRDRIDDDIAGQIATRVLRSTSSRYAGYEVVNTALARTREVGRPMRWIVLLDRRPRTALREAVVVELDGTTGRLLQIRPAWASHMSFERAR